MSAFKHSRSGRVIAIATGFLTAVLMLGGAAVVPAHAQTVEELQKSIADLQAMIAKLSGGSSAASAPAASVSYTFTRNLKVGDKGPDVMALQKILNSNPATQVAMSGAGSPGMESSYFGPATKRAVIAFQEWKAAEILAPVGLTKGTGLVGPSTRNALNAWAMSSTGSTGGSTGSTGGSTGSTGSTGGSTGSTGGTVGGGTTLPAGAGLTIDRLNKDVTFIAIPTNSSATSFGQYKLTAGTSEARITGMTIRRTGLGSKNDFDEVWLVANGVMHGNEQSVTTGDVAVFNISSDPIVIPAGQSVTLEVMAAMVSPGTAGQYNTLGIAKVDANVPVNATLPLDGPQTTTAAQSVASVTMTVQGSAKNVDVGSMQTEIGRFQLDVSSSNDQSVVLKRLTLRNQGAAKDLQKVIANAALKVGSDIISSKVDYSAGGQNITFQLGDNGYLMKNGQTQSVVIVADVISAELNDTIQLQLERAFDLVGNEAATGVGIRVKGNDGVATDPASNVDFKVYTMKTGKINFATGDSSSHSNAAGISDVVFLDGKLVVGAPFRADGLKARLASGTATAANTEANLNTDLNNVNLRIDGVSIKAVDTVTSTGTSAIDTGSAGDYYNFNSKFNVEVGTHKLQVTANIRSGATANDAIKMQVFSADLDSPKYTVTNDSASTEVSGSMLGSLITIKSATLTATRNDGFASETIVGGRQGVKFMSFTLDANDSSDIHVTGMTFGKVSGQTYTTSDVTNMRLWVGGKEVATPVDLSNGNFSNVDFTVAKSQQVQVDLMLDLNTTSSSATLKVELTSVNAYDTQGNTASVLVGGSAISSSNSLTSAGFTVSTGGSFTLTGISSVPSEDILVGDGGAVWYPVATYNLIAKDDDIKVTDLYFGNATSTATVIATSTFADARVATLGIFDAAGVLKGAKTLSSGVVHFDLGKTVNATGLGAILVPKNTTSKMTVKAKLNTIKDANKTGALLRLVLDSTAGTGNTGVTVQSASTGSDLASSSIVAARNSDGGSGNGTLRATTTASDFFALRRTKPAITQIAQVGSSETELSDFTQKAVYRFSIAANSNEDVAWKGVKFVVTGSLGSASLATTTTLGSVGNQYGQYSSSTPTGTLGFTTATTSASTKYVRSFRLYDASANQEIQNQNYLVHVDWNNTRGEGEVAITLNNNVEEVIPAGTSKTYELRADVGGVAAGNNALNVRIRQEANDRRGAADLVAGKDPDEVDGTADGMVVMTANSTGITTPYSFLWSDNSGSPHSSADNDATVLERDWTNDRFVKIDSAGWNRSKSF